MGIFIVPRLQKDNFFYINVKLKIDEMPLATSTVENLNEFENNNI